MADLLLRTSKLHKSYNQPVLIDFDFELEAGEVHALMGSNGAGKSTFARILCGLTRRDAGEVFLGDRPINYLSREEGESSGIVMVMQELNVIGTLSLAENLFLGRLPRRFGLVRFGELNRLARLALGRVGLERLDPRLKAGELGIGEQQLVEIAAALAKNCQVLILDEPTAALTQRETDQLFANVRRLQNEGVGVLYITHRMEEIRRLANRVTVLRDGRRIATHPAAKVSTAELLRDMVGHELVVQRAQGTRQAGDVLLRVKELRAGVRVKGVSLDARRGEILGISGLVGSGRTETLRAIFGADRPDGGEIWTGSPLRKVVIKSPRSAIRQGIGMVPEDRKAQALLLGKSLRINTTLATLGAHSRAGGWLNSTAEGQTFASLRKRLAIHCADGEQVVAELSGGNQQKIVMARWLARQCEVLLFDEPTRGIDVAAKETIWQLLRDLAGAGKAIVVVSSELPELMSLCDRILVMSDGEMAGEFMPREWSAEGLTAAAFSRYLGHGV